MKWLGSLRRGSARKTKREKNRTWQVLIMSIDIDASYWQFINRNVCPHPFLVWLYLKIPIAQRIRSQQSRIVAVTL